jgi:hypothetical protein
LATRLAVSALILGLAGACSVIDSVSGYDGPPLDAATAMDGAVEAEAGGGGDGSPFDVASSCTDAAQCDDDNPCTDDSCWGNLCRHTAKPGVSCSDGNVCNGNEACDENGECAKGTPLATDDDNPCTDDSCDPKLGVTHVMQIDPPQVVVECGIVTCPGGYFVSKLTCLAQCGACNPYVCVNGVECTRICGKTLSVCCGNACGDDCPSGYAEASTTTTGNCGCGPGLTASCKR